MIENLWDQVWVQVVLRAIAVFAAVLLAQLPAAYTLVKVSARIMSRPGPMYPGRFHGIGWPIAEALKWIQKEDLVPRRADRVVFMLAPLVVLSPAILVFAAVPLAPGVVAAPLDVGLFFLLAVMSVSAIGVVMAAASSGNKFALIGGLRAVAQLISYELPTVLSAVAAAMLAGSLSLSDIVDKQRIPFVVSAVPFGAIAFGIFLIAALAEVMWAPFDMPTAESEIVAGPLTEYSGMRYFFFQMGELTHALALSSVASILFLGGWRGPFLPPLVWQLLKTSLIFWFFLWVRFTFPRLREQQLQQFAWKLLIPLGLINILGIAFYRVL